MVILIVDQLMNAKKKKIKWTILTPFSPGLVLASSHLLPSSSPVMAATNKCKITRTFTRLQR